MIVLYIIVQSKYKKEKYVETCGLPVDSVCSQDKKP